MARVATLALDALERSLLEEQVASGRLPHLRALTERSARFRLDAVAPYRSDLAWVRFLSGRPESSTGFHGLLTFDPSTYAVAGRGTWVGPPFYAGGGRRTIAFDVPGAVVDPDVDGLQVTGWGCHSPQWWRASSPAGLLTEIDDVIGTNPIVGNEYDISWPEPERIEALAEAGAVGTRRRAEALGLLLDRAPSWDLVLTATSEIHTLGHHMWFGVDGDHPLHGIPTTDAARAAMLRSLEEADAAVGALVAALPPDAVVIVFALHGMQAADDAAATVLLPELLHRRHRGRALLQDRSVEAWRAAGCPPVVLDAGEPWHRHLHGRFRDGPDLARRVGRRLPRGAYAAARRVAGRPTVRAAADLVVAAPPEIDLRQAGVWPLEDLEWQVTSWYRRRWPEMASFAVPTFDDAVVRINLEGRESRGLVPADGYRRACDEVVELARSLVDARTGAPAVDEVVRLRANDHLDPDGPTGDLLIRWAGAPDALVHPDLGFVGPVPHARTGSHSTNGFALIAGPGIEAGERPPGAVADLPATIRALLGGGGPPVEGRPLIDVAPS